MEVGRDGPHVAIEFAPSAYRTPMLLLLTSSSSQLSTETNWSGVRLDCVAKEVAEATL